MEASSQLESMIPDAILLAIASYLDEDDLMRYELISKKFRSLSDSLDKEVWQKICHRRWMAWPRYRWEILQESHHDLIRKTWKQRYLWVEMDYSRTRITLEELETSQWYCNFTPEAGGRGSETLTRCFFGTGFMIVLGWPPLRCQLVDGEHEQKLYVNDFPPHSIERQASNGEWVIKNQKVICVSLHETDTLTYRDGVFQG
eukprot:CAMPEP_0116118564 /NCGR_PEP_ID=MMETSP0329-20121206/2170_1 /TAXON_ID=697910 /ORGANISM="Pseudo-nitzschia arenysensis, Strain B593" /LENGTH=200 /DNA_ID=CAMNT_0003612197 /DNA_START=89 /DNA_END=691 /DNA_ORIENTATION=-